MYTPWDYEIDGDLTALIDYDTFITLSGGALSATKEEIEAKLDSVSAAVRDWCGWHVSPVVNCIYTGDGEGRLLVLPAMGVRNVSSLTIGGDETDYEWRSNGLVRLRHGWFPHGWRNVECKYEAGIESAALGEVVAQIVLNAMVAAPGIAEEHAGNVGATYNKTGDGITGGVSLLPRDRELLAPYKLELGV